MQIRNHSSVLWSWSMNWRESEKSRWRWAWEDELWRKSSIVLPQSQASRMKKASQTRCLTFAPYAWRRFTPRGVMRCGRGLRTTHNIVRPRLTTLGLGTAWAIRVVIPSTNSPMTLQRYAVFLYLQNLYLSTSKRCIKMGIPSLNSAIFYNVGLYFHSNCTNITNIPDSRPWKRPFLWTEYSFFRSRP